MAELTDGQWRLLESAYVESTELVSSILERFQVSRDKFDRRRKKYGWPERRRVTKVQRLDPAKVRAAEKALLMARFHRLINLKLEQLEEVMSRKDERTPTEKERETRALGSLIRTYEKVAGVEGQGNDDAGQNGPERQAETEALRRELAERIVRLRQPKRDHGK